MKGTGRYPAPCCKFGDQLKIAISGSGGTGKTTLCHALSAALGLPAIEEQLQPVVEAINQVHRAKQGETSPEKIARAERAYGQVCEGWLNGRVALHEKFPGGFVADRWALDILQRWLIAGIQRDNDILTRKLLGHVQKEAQQLDLVIITPMIRLQDEQVNEAGLHRQQSLSPRILSHAMYRGLLEQLTTVPRLYLSSQPSTVDQRVDQVRELLNRLRARRNTSE